MAGFLERWADAESAAVVPRVERCARAVWSGAVWSVMLLAQRRVAASAMVEFVVGFLIRCAAAVLLAAASLAVIGGAGLLIGHGRLWSQACGWALLIAWIAFVAVAFLARLIDINKRVGETAAAFFSSYGLLVFLGIGLTVTSTLAVGPAYQLRYGVPVDAMAEEHRCVQVHRSSQDDQSCQEQRRLIATASEQDLGWWPWCGVDLTNDDREQLRVDPIGWFATYQDCGTADQPDLGSVMTGWIYGVVLLVLALCWYVLVSAGKGLWRMVRAGWVRCRMS